MDDNKSAEFLVVLLAALLVGGGAFAILQFLKGDAQLFGAAGLIVVIIGLFRVLRKRFGRT